MLICPDKGKKTSRNALLSSSLLCLKAPLALGILPRLLLIGFKFAQPLLINRTIAFADDRDLPDDIGWGLVGAFGLVFIGQAVRNLHHFTFICLLTLATDRQRRVSTPFVQVRSTPKAIARNADLSAPKIHHEDERWSGRSHI